MSKVEIDMYGVSLAATPIDTTVVSYGSIQWKGTDVCMDVHCKCGAITHVDGEGVLYVSCESCGTEYSCGVEIKLTEI